MKKKILILTSIFLLTSCQNTSTLELKEIDYTNLNKFYSSLNSSYSNYYLNYEKTTYGSINSNKFNIDYSSRFIKNERKYYQEETFTSSTFKDYSLERYEDYSSNEFGYTETLDLENNKGINYSPLEFLDLDDYSSKFFNTINSITPYLIKEDNLNASISKAEIKENTSTDFIVEYTLNNENIYKINENNEYTYSSLESNYPSIILLQSYFSNYDILGDTSIYELISTSFTISFNKVNNTINSIMRNEKFKISQLTFESLYVTTFNKVENNYSESSKELMTLMDKNVLESGEKALLELYQVYKDLDDKYKTLNYYSVTNGTANALGGVYSQVIQGYKLKLEDDYFFTTITTSSFVKKAESRYHNSIKNSYKIGIGDNPSSSGLYGSVSKWNKMKDYSQNEYISTIGHLMDSIANYILDEDLSKSFTKAKSYKKDGMYVYSFNISVNNDDKHIDACKDYKIEMNHMSNMGLPSFSNCNFEIYLDSSKEYIIKTKNIEEYTTGGFKISSEMTNDYYILNANDEIPNEILSTYNNLIKE